MFPLDQYNALRTGCGIVDLADWSSVSLSGADRQSFLHNFCTNDIKRLTPGLDCEAFVTNVKGKVVGHVLVTCREDELVLITVPGRAAVLVEHLDRYLIREDVQLRDTTAERAYLVASGFATLDALAHLEQTMTDADSFDRRPENFAATLGGIATRIIAWHWLGKSGRHGTPLACLVECSPDELPDLRRAILAEGAVECGPAAFTAMRIENGMPLYGVDFDESNFPQEVGRDQQAISFTKGCYLGQETVARIDALGHVNQQLVGVRLAEGEVPPHGTELSHGGSIVGHVGSAAFSPRFGAPLALAMVRREFTSPGSRLESPAGACEVVALPVTGHGN